MKRRCIIILALLCGTIIPLAANGAGDSEVKSSAELKRSGNGYALISPRQLNALKEIEDLYIINLSPATDDIPGTDLTLTTQDLVKDLTLIPEDLPTVVYCQAGSRSQAMARDLAEKGYDNIIFLEGGRLAWDEADLP
jgi:rhodanese-related sulfurtransferase